MVHVGKMVESELHNQGRSVTWFSRQIYVCRQNVYKIFQKESLDTAVLWRISAALGINFFERIAEDFEDRVIK